MRRKEKILTLSVMFVMFFLISQLSVFQVKSESIDLGRDYMTIASSPDGIVINSDGDFSAYSSSGDGGASTPWIIRDLDIDTTDIIALKIEDTTHHFEIRNCTLSAMYGIYLDNVTGGTSRIENNTIYDCNSVALYLKDTNGTWIEDNILINNHRGMEVNYCYVTHIINNYLNNRDAGIFLRFSPYSSLAGNQMYGDGLELQESSVEDLLTIAVSSTTVNDKPLLFSKNEVGSVITGNYGQIIIINGSSLSVNNIDITDVDIGISIWFSENINIAKTSFENVSVGIEMIFTDSCSVTESYFIDGSDGIYMDEGYNNFISLNHFERLSNGIGISGSTNILVTLNNFYNNSQEAAYFDACYDCQIYWNNFTDNNNELIQGYDDAGSNNTWYNSITQEGNFWDNYGGTGPYPIDGSTGSEDLYPLTDPYIIIPELSLQSLGIWMFLISMTLFFIITPVIRKRK